MIELITTEQQERIAREIMGWTYGEWVWTDGVHRFDMPHQSDGDFLWPLETALIERTNIAWGPVPAGLPGGCRVWLSMDPGFTTEQPTRGECLIEAALSILPEVAETGSSLAVEVGV